MGFFFIGRCGLVALWEFGAKHLESARRPHLASRVPSSPSTLVGTIAPQPAVLLVVGGRAIGRKGDRNNFAWAATEQIVRSVTERAR